MPDEPENIIKRTLKEKVTELNKRINPLQDELKERERTLQTMIRERDEIIAHINEISETSYVPSVKSNRYRKRETGAISRVEKELQEYLNTHNELILKYGKEILKTTTGSIYIAARELALKFPNTYELYYTIKPKLQGIRRKPETLKA
jgi:uncharacterized coiled-coil DUF342 family protein